MALFQYLYATGTIEYFEWILMKITRFLWPTSSRDDVTVAKEQQRRVGLPLLGDCMWSMHF